MTTPTTSRAELQAQADETLAAFRRGAQEIRQRAEQAEAAIRAATGHLTSPDGSVSVTVSPDGLLQKIEFRPDAMAAGPAALAETIMTTTRAATAQALRQARDGVATAFGEDNAATEVLDRRLAAVEPAPSRPAQPPQGREF